MKTLISTNPAKNYEKIGEVQISSRAEIAQKVKLAYGVKQYWKEIGVSRRIQILQKIRGEFLKKRSDFIRLITKEIGKPIRESEEEFDSFFLTPLKLFVEDGKKYISDEIAYQDQNMISKIICEPYGVAAVILPWNFPLEMFVWGVIPNLIVGNPVIMKHSEECPLTGKLIEDVMAKIDLPKGVFSEVYGDGTVGEQLVNENIDLLWFTGSSNVGKYLYGLVSQKNKFVKSIMELGGSTPGIVFKDADLNTSIEKIYYKRFLNCGQACNAIKRLLVHTSIYDEVLEKIYQKVKNMKVGDPEDRETDLGSLVAKRQLKVLKNQVKDAVSKGAKVIIGGNSSVNLKGAYYLPTILTNIKTDMKVWLEEVFGPVLPIIPFRTEEEAIKLANDTIYGLSAVIFTRDKNLFQRVAAKIDAGVIEMNNTWRTYFSPFGGYKMSGIGREQGKHGFQDLCQIKVIAECK